MTIPKKLAEAAAAALKDARAAGDPTERYGRVTDLAHWHRDQAEEAMRRPGDTPEQLADEVPAPDDSDG